MCINQLAGIDRIPSAPIPQLGLSNILILILILKIWGRKGEGGGGEGRNATPPELEPVKYNTAVPLWRFYR